MRHPSPVFWPSMWLKKTQTLRFLLPRPTISYASLAVKLFQRLPRPYAVCPQEGTPRWTRWPHQQAPSWLWLSWNLTVALEASQLLVLTLSTWPPFPSCQAMGPPKRLAPYLTCPHSGTWIPPRGQPSSSHPLLGTPNCFTQPGDIFFFFEVAILKHKECTH